MQPSRWLLGALSKFGRDNRGQISMVFAFLLVPFVAAVGSAVDFSSANSAKASIAGALDAAVLAGARDGTSSWQTRAQNVFTATLAQTGATNVNANFSKNDSVY